MQMATTPTHANRCFPYWCVEPVHSYQHSYSSSIISNWNSFPVRQCTPGSISSEVDCRFQNTLIPLLSRFNCSSVPQPCYVKSVIPTVATFALLVKPFFALREISCGMNTTHPEFWVKCKNPNLTNSMYELLFPTNDRVLEMISEPSFHTMGQEMVFDFLWWFIPSLSCNEWAHKILEIHDWLHGMWGSSHKYSVQQRSRILIHAPHRWPYPLGTLRTASFLLSSRLFFQAVTFGSSTVFNFMQY